MKVIRLSLPKLINMNILLIVLASIFVFRCYLFEPNEWEYAEIYLYNLGTDTPFPILDNGEQLSNRVAAKKRISKWQYRKAINFSTGIYFRGMGAACFSPHHAVVFFDSQNKPVNWVEICFSCERYRSNLPMETIISLGQFETLILAFTDFPIQVSLQTKYMGDRI